LLKIRQGKLPPENSV